jgi:hypothetical protein
MPNRSSISDYYRDTLNKIRYTVLNFDDASLALNMGIEIIEFN